LRKTQADPSEMEQVVGLISEVAKSSPGNLPQIEKRALPHLAKTSRLFPEGDRVVLGAAKRWADIPPSQPRRVEA